MKRRRGEENIQEELERDLAAGRDALSRALATDWWEWLEGSRLFFWVWPEEYLREARDGTPTYQLGSLPSFWGRQKMPANRRERDQLSEKIKTVIKRGYFENRLVPSLTGYFPVPKGQDDIRVVYDASKCS